MSGTPHKYRESYFQHPSMMKISGDHNYTIIDSLECECKAKGNDVQSTLGSGIQGHLGLVCSTTAYNHISPNSPFVRPYLPVLSYLTKSTTAAIDKFRRLYANQTAIFQA